MKYEKVLCFFIIVLICECVISKSYFVSPTLGDDSNIGTSKLFPFKTLERLDRVNIMPGDSILLHTEGVHHGMVSLIGLLGNKSNPIIVSAYDTYPGRRRVAKIDASEKLAGVFIENSKYVFVSRLYISANGGTVDDLTSKYKMRCGILVNVTAGGEYGNINLEQIHIENIFYNPIGMKRGKGEVNTANGTQPYGWGIRCINQVDTAILKDISINNCSIENVAHTGIKITGKKYNIKNFNISYNNVIRTGGPGIQISCGESGHVHDNKVLYSGSEDDTRKWGRGSGLWTWGTKDVIIEKNHFMYANGPGDSAGAHIDYNCDNIIMQYNFSAYNAGGFCEILGNNYNCVYRYNISVNDGFRRKGEGGAFQEGKTLWTSGYIGKAKPKGPFNSFIYNNTIYADEHIHSQMAIGNTTDGLWIANNIIYLRGGIKSVLGDQYRAEKKNESKAKGIIVCNNLFYDISDWNNAVDFPSQDSFTGNPEFINEGGICIDDYIPQNIDEIVDRGVKIPLPEDIYTLEKDILGNRITGNPDLGAIELE